MLMTFSCLTRICPVTAAILAFSLPSYGQQAPAPDPQTAPEKIGLYTRLSNAFSGPLHPVFKGVASGGGVGVGVAYDFPSQGRWQTRADAVVTIRRYWSTEVDTTYSGDLVQFEGYARMREMSQLYFFGQGLDSRFVDRTTFLLRDPTVGARASLRLAGWMAVGGRVEQIWPEVDRGRSNLYPTIQARFGEPDAPGLTEQPRFGRYQGFLEFQAPAGAGQALNQGGQYRIAYGFYDDQQFDRYSFNRVDLEAQHQFAGLRPHQRLTLHGWLAATEARAGNEVPFFLQPTIGGTGQVHSINDQIIGSDGSRGTLRGYQNFRFRDRNLLLLQAEYRIPVWGPVDASVFADAGTVAGRRADLSPSDLKHSYGFGISVMRGPLTVARTDFGFGSGEGAKISIGFGVGGDLLP